MNNHNGMMLINALNLHKSSINSLLRISKKQNDCIKKQNFSKLFSTRDDKEGLLHRLKKWGRDIKYYYENWSELQEHLTEEERIRILTLVDSISKVIEDVLIIESENRIFLEKRKTELTHELGTIDFFQECLISVYTNRN